MIPQDKLMHFFIGFFIYVIATIFIWDIYSLIFTLIVSIFWEVYNIVYKNKFFSIQDVLFSCLAPVVLIITNIPI